tara:strand:- start:4932 stop:6164 length:1233 start_codon:yes stop_codon:yes gene_type:complete
VKKNILIKNSFNNKFENQTLKKKLFLRFNLLKKEILKKSKYEKNFFNIFDKNFKLNFTSVELKKFKKFQTVVIIGMGGSTLGSQAIYQSLGGKIRKKFYFFDNLDDEKIKTFNKTLIFSKTLFIIVSKSGNTIETISNFLSLKIIKKYRNNLIIISEKKNNFLYLLARKQNIFFIEHKTFIGGRYSVFSEVSLVPAYLMGLKISSLRKNLKKYLIKAECKILRKNSIKLSSILLEKNINSLIFLNYSTKLNKLLQWCQQLIGESLGKKSKGLLPVLSNVPKDHHSLLQLYLDGPRDKIFYIISLNESSKNKVHTKKYTNKLNFINNKTISDIKKAQKAALKKVLIKKGIPFVEFVINKVNEETIGEFFSYFMLETIFSGFLAGINPFNQDAVEEVKILTEKELTKQRFQK